MLNGIVPVSPARSPAERAWPAARCQWGPLGNAHSPRAGPRRRAQLLRKSRYYTVTGTPVLTQAGRLVVGPRGFGSCRRRDLARARASGPSERRGRSPVSPTARAGTETSNSDVGGVPDSAQSRHPRDSAVRVPGPGRARSTRVRFSTHHVIYVQNVHERHIRTTEWCRHILGRKAVGGCASYNIWARRAVSVACLGKYHSLACRTAAIPSKLIGSEIESECPVPLL
jgi:hypothetical protein